MKSKLFNTVLVLFALTLVHANLRAQESPEYEHSTSYDDKTYHDVATDGIGESERNTTIHNISKTVTPKDSSVVRPVTAIHKGKPAPMETKEIKPQGGSGDDSIMTFNFLYYIIQRFKMQDIIE